MQLFRSKNHLKLVVHDFHIRTNCTFHTKKTNMRVYTIHCTKQNYKWRLYATRRSSDDVFIINTRDGLHSCVISYDSFEHPHLTTPFIASIIREHIKVNIKYKVDIEQRYNYNAPYLKCWSAKEIVIAQLFGGKSKLTT